MPVLKIQWTIYFAEGPHTWKHDASSHDDLVWRSKTIIILQLRYDDFTVMSILKIVSSYIISSFHYVNINIVIPGGGGSLYMLSLPHAMCILSIGKAPYCRLPIAKSIGAPPPIADRLRNPTPYYRVKGSIQKRS
jgi:hypothetical protein